MGVPISLAFGAMMIDTAVLTYTTLFIMSNWNTEFSCYFITEMMDALYDSPFLVHRMTLLTSICATFMGWLAFTIITIYTIKRLLNRDGFLYDPYEVAPMTPCLAFVTLILLVATVCMWGIFRPSYCSNLIIVVIILLGLGSYLLFQHFSFEKERLTGVSDELELQMKQYRLNLHQEHIMHTVRMRTEVQTQVQEMENLRLHQQGTQIL